MGRDLSRNLVKLLFGCDLVVRRAHGVWRVYAI